MKMKAFFPVLTLVGIFVMLAGCDTTLTPHKGQRVRFAVTSGRGLNTKTSYSGKYYTENNLRYERIDWVEGEQVRIVSSDAGKVATPQGSPHYDYLVSNVRENGRKSEADLADIDNTNGLVWGSNDVDQVTFYGVYPLVEYAFTQTGNVFVCRNMTIDSNPTITWDADTGFGNPDMSHAYMVSAPAHYNSQAEEGTKPIHLDFYPLFNAFEIDLASKDKTLTLKKLELIAEEVNNVQSALAGKFFYNNKMTGETDGPSVSDIDYTTSSDSYKLTVNLEGKTISPSNHVKFTMLALPGDLTNLTLAVTFVDPKDATKDKTRKLRLNENTTTANPYGTPITFPAFQKARLIGLAVDEGTKWELTVQTQVNEWTYYDEGLSALDQINVAPLETGQPATVKVTGSIELTPEGKAIWNKGNHELPNDVPEDDPSFYERYYQIRTLNYNLPANKQFFEMSFTPTAPVGGYWQLVPEAVNDDNSLDFFRFEVMIQGVTGFEEQAIPHGQIINRRVFVRIYPKNYSGDMNVYEIIMKAYFSPNIHFDPAYSADSELQDVHGNGQFSYWRFRLDSGMSGTFTPGDPEHDSDTL